ncbi:MAG: hypothetical protein IPK15_24150 [Verrucomicrobia bacterium]|nr:hypothetical protein [Verrucomicrobiota bacterium]
MLVNLARALPALILAVAVLILAGRVDPHNRRTGAFLNNIIICLDVSGSMTAPFQQHAPDAT